MTSIGAQAQTVTFTGTLSTSWNNAGNWDSGDIPNNNHAGATIIINQSVYITGNITLSAVKIKVLAGGTLQIGNGSGGGANAGSLTLTGNSAISLEPDATNPGRVTSNTPTNTNNIITIGGVTKFQGNINYSAMNSNSGVGFIAGPALAAIGTGSGAQGFVASTLPVVLVGFNANLTTDNKVAIKWSTQQETSTDHFEIQRSSDGISWTTIATVKASGYSAIQKNYAIQDDAPQTGTNLYRMRMIDFDAHFGFSAVVNVRLSLLGKVSVFPNPSVNTVTVSLGHAPASSWTLSLVNQIGQIVVRKTFGKDVTTASLPVNIYPAGNYSVDVTDGVSTQSSKLLIAHQ
jgi:hypothetical protein